MQKNIRIYFLVSVFISLITVNSVLALTISVSDNVTDFLYLAQGNSATGSFNINPAIPVNNNYNQPYDIISAYITYNFYDNSDPSNYSGNSVSPYYYYGSYYSRSNTYYYYNPYESAGANTEGQAMNGSTNYFSYSSYNGYHYDGGYYNGYYFVSYYTYYYLSYSGYNGGFTLTQYLDPTRLASLSGDGILNFTVSSLSGDLYFNSATLTAEIDENPQSAVVPEPSTFLLLGMGLVGAGLLRRKFRN